MNAFTHDMAVTTVLLLAAGGFLRGCALLGNRRRCPAFREPRPANTGEPYFGRCDLRRRHDGLHELERGMDKVRWSTDEVPGTAAYIASLLNRAQRFRTNQLDAMKEEEPE